MQELRTNIKRIDKHDYKGHFDIDNLLLKLFFIIFLITAYTPDSNNMLGFLHISIPIGRAILTGLMLISIVFVNLLKDKLNFGEILFWTFAFRILYFILNSLFYIDDWSRFINYLIIISIMPMLYICLNNLTESKRLFYWILKSSIIVLSIQIISTFILIVISGHGLYQVKALINIPIAYSNAIATIILMHLCLSFILLNNKIYFFLCVIDLLCTLSKAGFLVGIFVVSILLILSVKSGKNILFIGMGTLILTILFMLFQKYFSTYFVSYQNAINDLYTNNFNALNNGRTDIYKTYISNIKANIIFGNGLGSTVGKEGMAHNFILQSMSFGGLIGTLIYFFPFIYLLFFKRINKKIRISIIMLLIVMICHGFVENVFFTLPTEVFAGTYLVLLHIIDLREESL